MGAASIQFGTDQLRLPNTELRVQFANHDRFDIIHLLPASHPDPLPSLTARSSFRSMLTKRRDYAIK
jgi:hypothetical protein